MLTFSQVFMGLDVTWTLCSWSLFLVQPSVLQILLSVLTMSSGRQIGRIKSVVSIGSSKRTNANMLPSTGDRTMPTIRRSCCQGVVLWIRTVPNLAVHSAFGCPCDKLIETSKVKVGSISRRVIAAPPGWLTTMRTYNVLLSYQPQPLCQECDDGRK